MVLWRDETGPALTCEMFYGGKYRELVAKIEQGYALVGNFYREQD